jgi:hypothetical protein
MRDVACLKKKKKQIGASCVLAENLIAFHNLRDLSICNRISSQQAINMGKLGIWFSAFLTFVLIGTTISAPYFGYFDRLCSLVVRVPGYRCRGPC